MVTYQEFLLKMTAKGVETAVIETVQDYKGSCDFKESCIAKQYFDFENTTIKNFQKYLFTVKGNRIPDFLSANYKLRSNFMNDFVVQLSSYLCGNGVFFADTERKKLLGRRFDNMIYKASEEAQIGGFCFLYWELNKIRIFNNREALPLFDERNGELAAVIRFFTLGKNKPDTYILYESDGVTEFTVYKDEKNKTRIEREDKKAYIIDTEETKADGLSIVGERNYDRLPLFILWNNTKKSRLNGLRESIDGYDLIKSGMCNDFDQQMLYWILKGCGGMSDEVALTAFIERMKTIRAASVPEGCEVESHTLDIPSESREKYLNLLEDGLYRDAHAVNTRKLADSGNVTATAIRFAYKNLDELADEFEFSLLDTLYDLLDFLGLADLEPTFKRNLILNQQEITNTILSAAEYLDEETIIELLPFLTPEMVEQVKKRRGLIDEQPQQNKIGYN